MANPCCRGHCRAALAVALAVPLFGATAAAQRVIDVGLTMPRGLTNVGQECGPARCLVVPAGIVQRGSTITFLHHAAPQTPFALAFSLPGTCTTVPGIANGLLLGPGLTLLDVSITSSPPFVPTLCNQGIGQFTGRVPLTLPTGLRVFVQSLGWSSLGIEAFGPALDVLVQ